MNYADFSKEQLVDVASQMEQKIATLEEKLRFLLRNHYKPSSESFSPDQLSLLSEDAETLAQPEEPEVVEVVVKRRGNRKPCDKSLERERIEYTLPEEERQCDCGETLKEIGVETSEQYDFIPARYRVIEHIQHKYACPCCEGNIKQATKPVTILPKVNVSARILAQVAVSKFVDAVPFNRQIDQFARGGLGVARNSMARWIIQLSEPLGLLMNLLEDAIRAGPYQQCDESPIQVHKEQNRNNTSKSWIWARRGGAPGQEVILFTYSPSRSSAVVKSLFEGYNGYVQCDGYAAYRCLEEQGITLVGCLAHARRKFNDVLKSISCKEKVLQAKAATALTFFKQLYAIEKPIKLLKPDEKKQVRQEQAIPIFKELEAWLGKQTVLPKTPMGKAVQYTQNQWEKLIRYCDDGHLEIDNNSDERVMKRFAMGRKNWLFADSPAGAKANAVFYSLIETYKLHGQDPFAYLYHVFKELPKVSCVEDVEALLPWNTDTATLKEKVFVL